MNKNDIMPLPIPLPSKTVRKKKKPLPPPEHTVKSIDEKHNETMRMFREIDEKIPEWNLEYKKYIAKIKKIAPEWDLKFGSLGHHDREELLYEWKEKSDECLEKIKEWESRKKKYIMENADFIFKYFEDKKQISDGKSTVDTNDSKPVVESKNRQLFNKLFKIKSEEEKSARTNTDARDGRETREDKDGKNDHENHQTFYNEIKQRNLHKYWKNVCNEIPNVQETLISSEMCENCGKGEYVINEEEGTYNCHVCGHFTLQYVNTQKNFNNEAPGEVTYTTYDRLIHFKEILSQFQAKETTKIPEEIVNNIANRIRKERITDISQIDYDKMREILRTLGYNQYFEHIQLINSIFGIEPPQMQKELYDTLCVLFMEIQKPWALYCPPNRTNFFNYTYVLYQLCVLLGQHQYLPFIPMMKNPKKRLNMDEIWEKLCEHLDWEYIALPY